MGKAGQGCHACRVPLAGCDLTPLFAGSLGTVLGEGGVDPGRDDAALGLADMGHGVAHEVDPAALHGRESAASFIQLSIIVNIHFTSAYVEILKRIFRYDNEGKLC
jgi:hypothetical protein